MLFRDILMAAARAGGGVSYEAEALTYFAAMSVAPDDTRKGHLNTLIASLKTAGVWAKLDGLYIMAAHDAQAARVNAVNPASVATANGTITFTTDRGYAGNGTTGYLNTGFNPTTAPSPKYARNSAHMGAWSRTAVNAGVEIGVDITWDDLKSRYDAVLVATGSTKPRDLPVAGRSLQGVHFAMEYLVQANKVVAGESVEGQISAAGKHVVILGGGDTGADCLGTATRQGAASVTTLAIGNRPPETRPANQPWPTFPSLYEVSSAHEEFGERKYLASTIEFIGANGVVTGIKVAETEIVDGKRQPKPGTETEIKADLVLIALGFVGPETETLTSQISTDVDNRGNIVRDNKWSSNVDGLFVAGDAGRGQSLIVWAIAEGRSAAAAIDAYLEGSSELPAPVKPTDQPISVYN